LERALDSIFSFLPEHFENPLHFKGVALDARIREDGRRADWRQLPQIAYEDDIDASERPLAGAIAAFCVRMAGASSSQVHIQDSKKFGSDAARLVKHQPANAQGIQKKFVHVSAIFAPALLAGGRSIDGNRTPRVHCVSANESCHRVLRSQKLKLHAMLPAERSLKEIP
jgi:hypothetical protein